jgi:hypothetical protein
MVAVAAVLAAFGVFAGVSAAASFTATGSAEQVYATGLAPNAKASLVNAKGKTVYTQTADSLGGLLFRNVTPGSGYRVRLVPHGAKSGPITVHSNAAAPWDPSVYNQTIKDSGYQYLTTRDGTKLALTVWPPTGIAGVTPGGLGIIPAYTPPYPTRIEYAGYGYADPSGPDSGIAALANAMGFAVVDIQMRGTGCSAGSFDYYEPLQNLDGYDIIETIAHQSWVKDHKVGMMGISYGAITQLFTAQLDPPDLEAIAPLSTVDATATTLYPGGIRNDGFAVAWALQRQQEAQPAGQGLPGTQPYADKQITAGDATCKANQVLHGEAANLLTKIKANSHYVAKVADPLDPISFVHKIKVPMFMACQFEDEQTGGHCADLAQHFTGTNLKWFNFTNGAHIDSLDPYTYNHWFDFLQLFVNHQAPMLALGRAETDAAAPLIFGEATGSNDSTNLMLPSDPIQQIPNYQQALQAFEKVPQVTVLFDNGAGKSVPRLHQGLLQLPGPRHDGAVLVLRPARNPRRQASRQAGHQLVHVQPEGRAGERFRLEHRNRRTVGQCLPVVVELAVEPGRHCHLLRVVAVDAEHRRGRRRRRPCVGPLILKGRRSPGDGLGTAPGRQRDVRSERVDTRERAQAGHEREQHLQAAKHAARADPLRAGEGRPADAEGQVRGDRDPAVLRGSRVPGRFPDPGHDLGSQRNPADLGL